MNWSKYLVFITLLLHTSCKNNERKLSNLYFTENEAIHINLLPEKDKKILFSELIKSIRLIPLETKNECLIAEIVKIEKDDNIYFVLSKHDYLIYCFDELGKFMYKIGERGLASNELLHPKGFAINKKKKEICIVDNYKHMHFYSYQGEHKKKKKLDLFFIDFIIKEDYTYFHTSKRHNYNSNKKNINKNLLVMDQNKNLYTYFDYDPTIYPNGGLYFDTKIPFNDLHGHISYCPVFNDTIFSIQGNLIKPLYLINFGDKKIPKDLNSILGDDALEYIINNSNYACYIQNICETNNFLRFNYAMGTQLYDVFFDKNTYNHIEGVLINDIFSSSINFLHYANDEFVGYSNSFEILFVNESNLNVQDDIFPIISSITEEDNPVLIEFKIKSL